MTVLCIQFINFSPKADIGFFKDIGIPLFAILITLLLFLAQNYNESRKARSDKRNKEIDSLRFLLHLINGSMNFCKNLIESCDELLEATIKTPYQIGDLDITAADDLIRSVEKINHEDIFHAYTNIVKDRQISAIFTSLDSLNRIRENIEFIWKDFKIVDRDFKIKIAQIMEQIILNRNRLYSDGSVDRNILNGFDEIQKYLEDTPDHNKGNYLFLDEVYFSKLSKYIISVDSAEHPSLHEIYELSFKGSVSIAQLLKSNLSFVEKLKSSNKACKKYYEQLERCKGNMDKTISNLRI